MSEAIESLRQDHKNMWKLLDVIEVEFNVFKSGETPDYELLSSALRYCLNYPELYHHPKEDLIFARLQERGDGSSQGFTDLHGEHEALNELTRRVSALVQRISEEAEVARPAAAELLDNFIATYRQHIRDEEKQFFPTAVKVLTNDDWVEIDRKIARFQDPFQDARAMDYQDLRRMVIAWGDANSLAS